MQDDAMRIKHTINTQRRRERLKAEGLCISCGKHTPAPNRRCCIRCLERQQVYHARSQAKKGIEPKPVKPVRVYEHPPSAWYLTFDAGVPTLRNLYQ